MIIWINRIAPVVASGLSLTVGQWAVFCELDLRVALVEIAEEEDEDTFSEPRSEIAKTKTQIAPILPRSHQVAFLFSAARSNSGRNFPMGASPQWGLNQQILLDLLAERQFDPHCVVTSRHQETSPLVWPHPDRGPPR